MPHPSDKKGFTFPEILVASGIMLMVLVGIFGSYAVFQTFWSSGATQVYLQSNTRLAVEELTRRVRGGVEISLFDNGDRIQVRIDFRRTPYDLTDDVTVEYYLSGDNLYYDPDIAIDNNSQVIARYVEKVAGQDLFKAEGSLLTVTIKSRDPDELNGYQGVDIATSVKLRNM